MANTHHTGIPKLQWVGAYPPCTPSASISVDLSPFCAGDSVMFTPTLNCVENVIIASYAWVVNGVIKSTLPDPFVTTELLNNDKVYFFFIANENTYVSNVITVVEKTEGCPDLVKYGLLYNWYAVTDVRNICADGWEVPEKADWDTLITYLGGLLVAGGKLKEEGLTYWATPNAGAINSYNFNARGSGIRRTDFPHDFDLLNLLTCIAVKDVSPGLYPYEALYIDYGSASCDFYSSELIAGYSVRTFRLATESELLLPDGLIAVTYTGNDGKVYPCTKIGTQVWTAANSAETKYRNGELIPEVKDGSAWAALTTGALCAYDNDWDNV